MGFSRLVLQVFSGLGQVGRKIMFKYIPGESQEGVTTLSSVHHSRYSVVDKNIRFDLVHSSQTHCRNSDHSTERTSLKT